MDIYIFPMARSTCVKCKKGHNNCQCPTTCRQCLQLGLLGSDGSCVCCKNCKQAPVVCEADDNCGGYEASGSTPCHPCSTAPPDTSGTTTSAHLSTFQLQKPPDLSMVQKDATTLNFFCNLLRKWSRVGGYAPKDQGDVFTIPT